MKPPKPVITIYEQDVLKVGEGRNGLKLSERHLDQLAILQRRLPTSMYQLEYKGVRFTDVVGVIQLPQLLIEVLPKVNPQSSLPEARSAWTQLLQNSGYLPQLGAPYPQLLTQPGALISVLQRAFIQEVEQLVHRGLVKEYRTTEEQRSSLRGKLKFAQQIRLNNIRQDRFFVRSQSQGYDHLLNQRLKQALRIIELSGDPQLSTALLLTRFQGVSNLPITEPWDTIPALNRLTQSYQQPLALAELICKGYLGGTFAGQEYGFSLLFSMPRVFETLIYRCLHSLALKQQWVLRYQPDLPFWYRKKIRPDFLLELPGEKRVVIDTKWKVLTRPEPNDEDLRQIFAYTQISRAQRGILLYPQVHGLSPVIESFNQSATEAASCEIRFISLMENPQQQLANLLFQ